MGDETPRFMAGGGAAGEAMRAVDWASTPLGPVETWSIALRTTVATMLGSRHPMFLWWGPELVQLYNDAYLPSFGRGKHPAAMGQRGPECWGEIWPIIGPQIDGVMARSDATYHEDQLVPILRNGRLEEVFWTYGYSPVLDDDETIGGCLVVCTETTGRALAERRLRCLQQLAQRTAEESELPSIVAATAEILSEYARRDLPFAMLYPNADAEPAVTGLGDAHAATLHTYLGPLLSELTTTAAPIFSPEPVPTETWPEPVEQLAVVPFGSGGGLAVFGLSPRLSYDPAYADFIAQLAAHLTASEARVAQLRARLLVERERDSLLMQAPVATAILVGPDLVFELANRRYRELVGGRELIGKGYLEAFPELVGTPVCEIVFGAYERGERFVTEEMRLLLDRVGDGELEECFYTFVLEPLRTPEGETYGLMAVAADITAQVRARKELERTQAELLEASQAKDEFLAMLGHELRNPLAPIVTALQLMRLRGYEGAEEERTVIERQLRHVVSLVDDLLDVARIVRGEIRLARERVSLAQVVHRAVEQASPLIERGQHHLEVEVDDGIDVHADPTRLAQVVANLLSNSAKYTPPGGALRVTAGSEDGLAVIRVVDDGIGLTEAPTTLFQRFQRGRRNPDEGGGLGIGLAIVQSMVAAHGGEVSLDSEGPGRGTEAIVRLPVAEARARDGADAFPAPAQPSAATILLVDDNEDAGLLLAMALRKLGHEVEVARDGPEALTLAAKLTPDVALLDLSMPVMDGYELLDHLRALPGWRDVRFIALTGYGQPSERERTRAAGFDAHLVKPIDVTELDRLIRALPGRTAPPSATTSR